MSIEPPVCWAGKVRIETAAAMRDTARMRIGKVYQNTNKTNDAKNLRGGDLVFTLYYPVITTDSLPD
jgi:hypothetical protein